MKTKRRANLSNGHWNAIPVLVLPLTQEAEKEMVELLAKVPAGFRRLRIGEWARNGDLFNAMGLGVWAQWDIGRCKVTSHHHAVIRRIRRRSKGRTAGERKGKA